MSSPSLDEYWAATSSHGDNRKLDALRSTAPKVSLGETIEILARII
jgi:hypothetical protein